METGGRDASSQMRGQNTWTGGATGCWVSHYNNNSKDQPEEEEDGPAIGHTVHVVIVIHVGFDGIDEARVEFLGLVEDEQSLGAAKHHVPYRLSQLALETNRSRPQCQHDTELLQTTQETFIFCPVMVWLWDKFRFRVRSIITFLKLSLLYITAKTP